MAAFQVRTRRSRSAWSVIWLAWARSAASLASMVAVTSTSSSGVSVPNSSTVWGRWAARPWAPSRGAWSGSRAATTPSTVSSPAARWSGWSSQRRQGSWPRTTSGRTARTSRATARRRAMVTSSSPSTAPRKWTGRAAPRAPAAAPASARRTRASSAGSAAGSALPFSPAVKQASSTWTPRAAQPARVPPAWSSTSSGWAPKASTRPTASIRNHPRHGTGAPEGRSGIDVAFACIAAWAGPPHARRAYPTGLPGGPRGERAPPTWIGTSARLLQCRNPHQLPIDRDQAGRRLVPAVGAGEAGRGRAPGGQPAGAGKELGDGLGPGLGLVAGQQDPGGAVAHGVEQAADPGRDHRGAAGLGLQGDQAERLRPRRHQEQVGRPVDGGQAVVGAGSEEPDPVGDPVGGGQPGQPGRLAVAVARGPADHQQLDVQVGALSAEGGQGDDGHVGRLERLEAAHEGEHVAVGDAEG